MLKTPVAVVRNRIGLSVEEFAHLLGCARGTIQRLERNDLKLSDKLARQIENQTAAPIAWLLANNPSLEPIIPGGLIWSEEMYQVHQGKKESAQVAHKLFGSVNYTRLPARQRQEKLHIIAKYLAATAQADIHSFLAAAILKGDHEFEKAVLALNRFKDRMEKEYGPGDEPTRELYAKDIAMLVHKDSGQRVLYTQHGKNYQIETNGKIAELKN